MNLTITNLVLKLLKLFNKRKIKQIEKQMAHIVSKYGKNDMHSGLILPIKYERKYLKLFELKQKLKV